MSLPSPRVKSDPEEEEDLVMSYLNEDCLSLSEPWLLSQTTSTPHPIKPDPEPTHYLAPELLTSFLNSLDTIHNIPMSYLSILPPSLPHLQPLPNVYCPTHRSTSPASSSSSDDGDQQQLPQQQQQQQQQQQRKRGRKKRCTNGYRSDMTPLAIAPLPTNTVPPPCTQTVSVPKEGELPLPTDQQEPQNTALAKRQARLIKNRAAALLSRKRKREHLFALEGQNQILLAENDSLKSRISYLEAKIQELKRCRPSSCHDTMETGVVWMFVFLSFAMILCPLSESIRRSCHDSNVETWIKESHGNSRSCHVYPDKSPSSLMLVSPFRQGYLRMDVKVIQSHIIDTLPENNQE